jgi:hypothetical protein
VDVPGASADAKAAQKKVFQPLAGHWWTSLDVLGGLQMAPRAGFQLHRKFLSEQVVQTASELDTPSDTPRIHALCPGVF